MMKEARTGGSFVWHQVLKSIFLTSYFYSGDRNTKLLQTSLQDYGYWYGNGCLTPEMGSIFMPLDVCVRENGCLQVLRGSHRMGRIEHGLKGDQVRKTVKMQFEQKIKKQEQQKQ